MAELTLPSGHVALIDEGDLDRVVAAGPWRIHRDRSNLYVRRLTVRKKRGPEQALHSFLTDWPMVDHVNGDGLDNRRANLRPANHSQNAANRIRLHGRTGLRGVTRHRSGRWQAAITVAGKYFYLGLHSTPEDAARAYDVAAVAAFGEYARPNFPPAVAS